MLSIYFYRANSSIKYEGGPAAYRNFERNETSNQFKGLNSVLGNRLTGNHFNWVL